MNQLYLGGGELDFEEQLPEVPYEIVVDWEEDTDGIEWSCTLYIEGKEHDITYELNNRDYFYISDLIEKEAEDDGL